MKRIEIVSYRCQEDKMKTVDVPVDDMTIDREAAGAGNGVNFNNWTIEDKEKE